MRAARVERRTEETKIALELNLDGTGRFSGSTPSGFFDHMLSSFTKHAGFDLKLNVEGDVHVDLHHSVEDTGIVLGTALRQALGDKRGIKRFGHAVVPMDESLVLAAVDISGRGGFFFEGNLKDGVVGNFPSELVEEFWTAFCREAGITLHVRLLSGKNLHHQIEAVFKAVAVALKEAVKIEGGGVPSTKGLL